MSARRAGRGLAMAAAAAALAAGAVPSLPAWAEDPIPSQEYVTATGLDQLKAQGLDGTGVTIAVIDGNIDTTVPELAGADIDIKASCTSKGVTHGTNILSDLADPVWGWAPKAHFLAYAADEMVDSAGHDQTTSGCGGDMDDMANRAINDGADIINISALFYPGPYTLARAAMRGIPIVTGSGNFGEYGDEIGNPWNTVVVVGATDMVGQRSAYSQYGPGLTVMAPADPNAHRVPDTRGGPLTHVLTSDGGTSTAAPMVTGALALAMQKWPDANGNQLISSLIATSDRAGHWDEHYGWGLFNPAGLISNDPSQYSTENPLLDAVPDGLPTRQDYDDYVNGTIEFPSMLNPYDQDYAPATPAPATPAPADDTSGGLPGWVLPAGITLVVVAAGVVVALVLTSRRRHRSTTLTAAPRPAPGQYPGPYPGYPQGYPQAPPQPYPQPQSQPPPGWAQPSPPPYPPYPPRGSNA